MKTEIKTKKWHNSIFFIYAICVILFPVGIYKIWRISHLNAIIKIVITFLSPFANLLFVIFFCIGYFKKSQYTKR